MWYCRIDCCIHTQLRALFTIITVLQICKLSWYLFYIATFTCTDISGLSSPQYFLYKRDESTCYRFLMNIPRTLISIWYNTSIVRSHFLNSLLTLFSFFVTMLGIYWQECIRYLYFYTKICLHHRSYFVPKYILYYLFGLTFYIICVTSNSDG